MRAVSLYPVGRRGRRPLQYIPVTMDVFTPNTGQTKNLVSGEERAYNPNQPRDGNGKWTATGGGGSSKKSVDKSADNGIIKATAEQRKQFSKELKGTKAQNGIIIQEVSRHACDRMVERNISANDIKSALVNPSSSYPGNKSDTFCVQKGNIRVIYSDSGNIISAVKLD